MTGLTSLLLDDVGEFLELSLGSEERTEPLLGQLPGLLVLGVPQQFHNSLLVRRETGNLPNDVLDEKLLFSLDTLSVGRLGLSGDGSGGSSTVGPESQVASGSLVGHLNVSHCVILTCCWVTVLLCKNR